MAAEDPPATPEAAWVRIPSGGEEMDGLWWPAPAGGARLAAVYLHGRALDMFAALGPVATRAFSRAGVPTLLFSRRGRCIAAAGPDGSLRGGAHHGFADHEEDAAAAVEWTLARGFEGVVLIGHSLGGLLAARYAAAHPERARALLLASPVSRYAPLPSAPFVLGRGLRPKREAERLVAEGRGEAPVLLGGWVHLVKARLVVEAHPAREAGALKKALSRARCPLYFTAGTAGAERLHMREGAAAEASPARPKEIHLREGGDHMYARDAGAVAGDMLRFLRAAGAA